MDEVDKIIIHSLRQIGCTIDDDINLALFTPELLVHTVSRCLEEIKPDSIVPRSMPTGGAMAQRFTVATTLAEMCSACGYRSDIGYQTFLYPNAVDVRRLLMFLVEHLPKENLSATDTPNQGPVSEYETLRREIKLKIMQQLRAPWTPQYSRALGNWRLTGCSSHIVEFAPQLNLNIPDASSTSREVRQYMAQQSPNVFQQIGGDQFDLISSILHKNAEDLYGASDATVLDTLKYPLSPASSAKSRQQISTEAQPLPSAAEVKSPLEQLNASVEELKSQIDELLSLRGTTTDHIDALKQQRAQILEEIVHLRKDVKTHERSCLVLESPEENVPKLEGLIATTLEKRKTLEQQWQAYRQPMTENLNKLRNARRARNVQSVMEMRDMIGQLEQSLRDKTAQHAQLNAELKSATKAIAPRKEYTRRIHEFIGNIRKQRNDIFKVLDDMRDLQKQLNSVSAQLQRQFNYTDDLLFHSAKHDMHAKKAYKLLAALHTTCNDLIDMVTQTGNTTKEIRDLEEQIDRERLKNIGLSLDKISADIRNIENVVRGVQEELRNVENEITAG